MGANHEARQTDSIPATGDATVQAEGVQPIVLDPDLAKSGAGGARIAWTAILAVAVIAAAILPVPLLRDWLDVSLSTGLQRWILYLKYMSELLLIMLFGGAIFTEGIKANLESILGRWADKNTRYLANHTDLMVRINRISAFAKSSQISEGSVLTYFADVWALVRMSRSPIFMARVYLLAIAISVPKGLLGFLAFVFIATKLTCDILLMQNMAASVQM